MELVLKLPKGKPPFVGVLFEQEYQGADLNLDLYKAHGHRPYKLVLEPIKLRIHLRLICEDIVTVRFYNGLKYDLQRLNDWMYLTKKAKLFTFGHVVFRDDKHYPVRIHPGNKPFALKVESLELLVPDDWKEDELPF